MKPFIYKILLFSSVIGLINVGIFLIGRHVYTGEYQEYSLDFNTYLFADSHGLGVGTSSEEYGVYNFSAGSDSYLDIGRKVSFLIANTDVDTVYMTVDDHTLSEYREGLNNLDRSSYYASREDYNSAWSFVKEKYIVQYFALLQPKLGKVVVNWLKAQLAGLVQSNTTREELNWDDYSKEKKDAEAKKRYKSQFESQGQSVLLKESLTDVIKMCKKNEIVLIGVKFPLTGEYLSLIKGQGFGADEVLKANGLRVLDYSNELAKTPELFKDQDHLNNDGGIIFSRLMFRGVKKMEYDF
jgi:hypothetical protein